MKIKENDLKFYNLKITLAAAWAWLVDDRKPKIPYQFRFLSWAVKQWEYVRMFSNEKKTEFCRLQIEHHFKS